MSTLRSGTSTYVQPVREWNETRYAMLDGGSEKSYDSCFNYCHSPKVSRAKPYDTQDTKERKAMAKNVVRCANMGMGLIPDELSTGKPYAHPPS